MQSGHLGIKTSPITAPMDEATRRAGTNASDVSGALWVFIVEPDPRRLSGFVAPLRHEIEELIGAVQDIETAPIRRVSVKDGARLVLGEHADAVQIGGAFGERTARERRVVVHRFPSCALLVSKRHAEIEVEIVLTRRYPFEA